MQIENENGLPLRKVMFVDENGEKYTQDNPIPFLIIDSKAIVQVDQQNKLASTIQTHNAVSVGASTWSVGTSWVDCDGFDKIAVSIMTDVGHDCNAEIAWSMDGINIHGRDVSIYTGTTPTIPVVQKEKSICLDVKMRYAKINIKNNDTAAHTMSAWAYLKV